jgi:hypothetical protein
MRAYDEGPDEDSRMAVMLASLYDALKAANVPDDKARQAAEEVADFRSEIAAVKGEIAAVKGEIAVLKWMVGVNITLTVLVLGGLLWR